MQIRNVLWTAPRSGTKTCVTTLKPYLFQKLFTKYLSVLHDSKLRKNWNRFKVNAEGPWDFVDYMMMRWWVKQDWQNSTRYNLQQYYKICKLRSTKPKIQERNRENKGTYNVVNRKIVFVFHVSGFELETDHVDNPKGSHQRSRIKQRVNIKLHHKATVQSHSQKQSR